MFDKAHIASVVLSLLLIVFILELVRRRRLKEEYSLLWLTVGILMVGLALWKQALDFFAGLVGIYYPPSALFLLGLIFVVVLLLHVTTVISRLTEQNKDLAQEVALLKQRLENQDNLVPRAEPAHSHTLGNV